MIKFEVKVSGDPVKNLEKLANAFGKNSEKMTGKIAAQIAVLLRGKFRSNGGERWWSDAANAVFKSNTPTTATVTVNKVGVALQRYGGTVRPKNGHRCLAIPLRREFRGKYPSELTGKSKMFYLARSVNDGKGYLAYNDGSELRIAYLLTPKAVIRPHPEKFLSAAEIMTAANEVVDLYARKAYGLSI